MYFLELWFPLSCQQACACMCWKCLGEEGDHGDGPKQHDPAWPWPQDPLCCHDLHNTHTGMAVFSDFVPLGLTGRSKRGFFGARLCVSVLEALLSTWFLLCK